MDYFKLNPLARAIGPSMILLGLTACGGGGGGGGGDDDTPRETENTPPTAVIESITSPQSIGNVIQLDGNASSDSENDPLTYQWSITNAPSGSNASITDSTSVLATLSGDLPGDYTVQLLVNDGSVNSAAVSATITLTNTAPIAHAGPDMSAELNGSVQLNGSASSDIDGQTLTFQWQIVDAPLGSAAYLDSANSVMPVLLGIDTAGDYSIGLTVNDGLENSPEDIVVVSTNNSAPLAHAGADIGGRVVGETVTLNGTQSSDPDGDSLTYSWAFTSNIPDGSSAILENADTPAPSFTIDKKGSYEIELTVSDGTSSNTDLVLVNVGNTAPVANAGSDLTVALDEAITLSAENSSDIDGDTLSFTWSILMAPAGNNATINNANNVTANFTPDSAGTYVIQVLVSDGQTQHTDSLEIHVEENINLAPVANAGPDQAFDEPGSIVMLDGLGSTDPEGDSLLYSWTFASLPAGSSALLIGADSPTPSFTPDIPGDYVAQLIVNDGAQNSLTADTVTISVSTNSAPVANAGEDQSIILGETIALNGDESFDPNGDSITYQWSVTSAPNDASTSFNNESAASPNLSVDKAGEYLVQLVVNDGALDHTDTMMVDVTDGDLDNDGLTSSFEIENGLNPNDQDSDGDGIIDGAEDEDSDNLSNQWEATLGYDINLDDSDSNGTNDGDEDFDNDGFSNYQEIQAGTDPANPDSFPISLSDQFSFELKSQKVVPGGELIYAVHISNLSETDTLTDTVVKLTVPEGVSFNRLANASRNSTSHTGCAASGSCGAGDDVFWSLGNLTPGESISFEVDATVASNITIGTNITTQVEVSSSSISTAQTYSRTAEVVAELPVSAKITSTDEPVAPGQHFTYQVVIGNPSDDLASALTTELTLPAGLNVVNVFDGGNATGNKVSWEDGNLLPTQSLTRRVEVAVSDSAQQATPLVSTATISTASGTAQILTDTITVSEPLKLELNYQAKKSVVAAGERLVYDFTISNGSTVNQVENAVMLLRVPAGVSFNRLANASRNSTGHSGCAASGSCGNSDEVVWELGTLQPGETISFQVNALVGATVTPGTVLQTPVFLSAEGLGDLIQLDIITQVVAQQEAHLSIESSHDPVAAEQSFDLNVMFANNSDDVMENSFINLNLPSDLIVNSISHNGDINVDEISWSTGHLLPGQSLVRNVNVSVAANALPGDIIQTQAALFFDDGLETDQVSSHSLTVSEPLRLKTVFEAAQEVVTPGGSLKYHLTISNTSFGSVVENPVIMLQVPAGVTFNRISNTSFNSSSHSGCSANGGCDANDEVFWQPGDLAAGQSITLEINASVASSVVPGTLIETPIFIHANGLEDSIHLNRSVRVVAENQAQFHIQTSNDAVAAGGNYHYELNIGNPSDDALENLQWQLHLPEAVTVAQVPTGASVNGNTVTWNQALLLPGQALKRELNVTVNDDTIEGTSLLARSTLTHDAGQELDQELNHVVSVSEPLKLALNYSLDQTVVSAGGNVQYAITVSNTSLGSLVENAVIMMQVPAGISFNRITNTNLNSSGHNGCAANGGCGTNDEVFWSLPQLAAGESQTIHINAFVAETVKPGTLIETPIYVNADGLEDTLQLQRSMQVVAAEPVVFTLLASEEPVAPGSSFTYHLTLGNSSNDLAESVNLDLILPEALSVDSVSAGGVQNGNRISWSVGNLPAANHTQRSVTVTLNSSATPGSVINAIGQLRYGAGAELDQELHTSVSVAEPQRLQVGFTQSKSEVTPGETVTYQISLQNTSVGSLVENAVVMMQIPTGISFNRVSQATPSSTAHNGCSANGSCSAHDEVFWNLGTIAAGETATVEITASVAAGLTPGSIIKTPIFVTADGLKDNIIQHEEMIIVQP